MAAANHGNTVNLGNSTDAKSGTTAIKATKRLTLNVKAKPKRKTSRTSKPQLQPKRWHHARGGTYSKLTDGVKTKRP